MHVNDILKYHDTTIIPKWEIDLTDVKSTTDQFYNSCSFGGTSWYGYNDGPKTNYRNGKSVDFIKKKKEFCCITNFILMVFTTFEGFIKTTLEGSGNAIFRFGNCHQNGGVKFFYNGKEIIEAAPKTVKMYNLKFSNGTTIELRQNGGIIRFDYFYVFDCGKYLIFLKILILN